MVKNREEIDNTTGSTYNTFFGYQSGSNTNGSGTSNAAFGYLSMVSNSSGAYNTAMGVYALWNNSTTSYNTAIGDGAMPMSLS